LVAQPWVRRQGVDLLPVRQDQARDVCDPRFDAVTMLLRVGAPDLDFGYVDSIVSIRR
jgi:hypothetical protein